MEVGDYSIFKVSKVSQVTVLTGHLSPGTQMLPISIPLHAELQLKLCVGDGFPTKSNALCLSVLE